MLSDMNNVKQGNAGSDRVTGFGITRQHGQGSPL